MLGLEYFSFSALFSPLFLAFMLLVTAAYFVLIGPLSEKFADSEPVPLSKKISFVCGMLILYLAQGGPISLLGHLMFTFHMTTMAFSYLVAPPLLMMGIPVWLWRAILKVNPFKKLGHFFARPVVAAVVFNGFFSLYHFPAVHDYVMLHFVVHRVYYLLLFIASILMWWTLINPLPEKNKASGLGKIGYIFLNMVLLTPACGLIIFSIKPMYATYSDPNVWAQAMGYCVSGDPSKLLQAFGGPTFFNIMSTKVDQQVGGIVMKFIQEFIFASMLGKVFFRWYKDENKEDDNITPAEFGDSSMNQA
ncbi:cytochrome c oxidase assembly factor CtaG [Paenibacillus sp.]|jgi:putative membrane protein|uniref:cytochrome c oxidase assembly factor CtaG n=1 Tax=Paenibacillus sp. TaxID=58172 RepID=UPI0028291AEC|nr:cytochrome c oxidase assembly factor CtaG [Paenibacillus sp.]MDR0271441.1 cytochrome c oxidase assembly factor CtaG [Paenibacillus sp.]